MDRIHMFAEPGVYNSQRALRRLVGVHLNCPCTSPGSGGFRPHEGTHDSRQ